MSCPTSSIYLHLPFCRALCRYCGYTKVIPRHQGDADTYLDYLEKELEEDGRSIKKRFDPSHPSLRS